MAGMVPLSSGGYNKNNTFTIRLHCIQNIYTVKPVLRDHLKIDKTFKVLIENGSLMKFESIAECWEHSDILLTCIKR